MAGLTISSTRVPYHESLGDFVARNKSNMDTLTHVGNNDTPESQYIDTGTHRILLEQIPEWTHSWQWSLLKMLTERKGGITLMHCCIIYRCQTPVPGTEFFIIFPQAKNENLPASLKCP